MHYSTLEDLPEIRTLHFQKKSNIVWSLGEDVAALEHLSPESKDVPLMPPKSEELVLNICSPYSPGSVAPSIVVHISQEERQKYEEEIRKLYKQLDNKVNEWIMNAEIFTCNGCTEHYVHYYRY